VFLTWKLSIDQTSQQKSRAVGFLWLIAILERKRIPRSILKDVPDLTISAGALKALGLVTVRLTSNSLQLHRLVQRFFHLVVIVLKQRPHGNHYDTFLSVQEATQRSFLKGASVRLLVGNTCRQNLGIDSVVCLPGVS